MGPVRVRGQWSTADTRPGVSQDVFAGVDASSFVPKAFAVHDFVVDFDTCAVEDPAE